ncbi:MAG: ATP-binding protein, partial [Mucinivorans sp.]
MATEEVIYDENNIRTLEWNKHIRLRPGMYIGKLGDGSQSDDGIYVLIKEVIDNSVDEYVMGHGRVVDIRLKDNEISVRDYGRGIPLGKLLEAASVLNTGAKYDSKAFKKSVGLNGVGIKAVNALSSKFVVRATREGERRTIEFSGGEVVSDQSESGVSDRNGTAVTFVADETLFGQYTYKTEFIEAMLRNYTYLNTGLTMQFNGEKFVSTNGLLDLLNENIGQEALYPPIHLSGSDIEVALT